MTSDADDGVQPLRSCPVDSEPGALVQAAITTPGDAGAVRYDLAWLFTCWAWEAGVRDWPTALRVLARALRGLERAGLIERRTRRSSGGVHHGFVLTREGREAVFALSGDWFEEDR